MSQLSKKIMRRIYYVFALRLLKHPITVHSAIVVLGAFMLSRTVSLPHVWSNMMGVQVGDLMRFWFNAFNTTEAVTLVLLTIVLLAVFSLPWRLRADHDLSLA